VFIVEGNTAGADMRHRAVLYQPGGYSIHRREQVVKKSKQKRSRYIAGLNWIVTLIAPGYHVQKNRATDDEKQKTTDKQFAHRSQELLGQ